MKYSIVIPCYKCELFFKRFMDSIVDQNFSDMEVILVRDDDSRLEEMCIPYNDKLNVRIVDTDKKIHTPGNSRNYGIDAAAGEWIMFMDCDDSFRKGAIKVFNKAMKKATVPCYFAKIKQFRPDGTELPLDQEYQAQHPVWLHGKCYHLGFIREHGIRFKPEMRTCEDYYFNYQVISNVKSIGMDYCYLDEYVYNWEWNDKSLSRSSIYVQSLREHFYDHVEATLMSWVNVDPELDRSYAYSMYLDFLGHVYFLYQYYRRLGIKYDTYIVSQSIAKVWCVFGLTMLDLINAFESDYEGYCRRYEMARGLINEDFVCQQGFREWILQIYN